MGRPRCDPFDIEAARAAIASGAKTERAIYLEYAATAARPYARSSFTLFLKRGAPLTKPRRDNGPPLSDRWRERAPVKPRIISLSPGGGLRVQAGALVAFDGERTVKYTRAAKPPLAVVLSSAGGFVSIEAIRFCARAGVAIVALDRAHGFLTVMTGAPKANAALIRAQAMADPLPIARAIVATKIEAMRHAGALARAEQFTPMAAMSLDQIRLIEAQASRAAWPHTPALQWDKGPIPIDWRSPWLMRARLDAKGKRGARHPVNAMLNAAFAVTAGRLAAYLAGMGLTPVIGFLHADKRGRWSLAWDAVEVLRPAIEARVFALIERERFALDDFMRAPDGSVRLASALLATVLNECAPSSQALARCVRWLTRLVLSSADENGAKNAKERLRDVNSLRLPVGGLRL
jgi:CRISPR-associated protein Cas1